MPLSIRNSSDAWQSAQDIRVRNSSGEWVQGCAHIWDGSTWAQFFGQNGAVSAGPGGTFAAETAISYNSGGASSGVKISLLTSGACQIVSEREALFDPTSFQSTTLDTFLYTPTVCSPDPQLLSARVVPTSGDTPTGESVNSWVQLGSLNRTWSIFAYAPTPGAASESGTFTLQLALTSDTSTILSSASYTLSGSATSNSGEVP
jgi:hypothetical protein